MDLRTDVDREGADRETGILVRAWRESSGRFDSVDISELDRGSLETWLRSRGGSNPWAESVVLRLLGHGGG